MSIDRMHEKDDHSACSIRYIMSIWQVSQPEKWQTLMINISLRRAERHFFLPDSFVSCKNASIEYIFITIW